MPSPSPWEDRLTDRTDRKLREFPIAEFRYRHEAEFAAGFLRDADIPYRLQVDDAGGVEFGLSGVRPAVLLVRGMDVERARELLDLEEAVATVSERPVARLGERPVGRSRLTARERTVAAALALAMVALGLGLPAGPVASISTIAAALVASTLSVVALTGRAPAPLRALLRTLSGEAP